MLRISIEQTTVAVTFILEGRIAGLWAEELSRSWADLTPPLGKRKLLLDLRNATYADGPGIGVLRDMYSHAETELLTSTPWTKYLAEKVMREDAVRAN